MEITNKIITIPRAEFLAWRRRQVADATEYDKNNPDEVIHICDPQDEIICDVCNVDVLGDNVHFNDWGLYCDDCRAKHKAV